MCPDKRAAAGLKCALPVQTPDLSCADSLVYLEGCELCTSAREGGSFSAVLVLDAAAVLDARPHRCLEARSVFSQICEATLCLCIWLPPALDSPCVQESISSTGLLPSCCSKTNCPGQDAADAFAAAEYRVIYANQLSSRSLCGPRR